jgi:hypothetical protein
MSRPKVKKKKGVYIIKKKKRLMIVKSPSLLEYKIEGDLLYYEYSRYILGFFCIELRKATVNSKNLKKIMNILLTKKIATYSLKDSKVLVFFSFKTNNVLDSKNKCEKIRRILSKIPIEFNIFNNDELVSKFFFNIRDIEHNFLTIDKNNEYLKISNDSNTQYIYNFHVNWKKLDKITIQKIVNFIQTINLNGYIQISSEIQNQRASLILISESIEVFEIFKNFYQNLKLGKNFSHSSIKLKDFKNIMIKNQFKSASFFDIKLIEYLLGNNYINHKENLIVEDETLNKLKIKLVQYGFNELQHYWNIMINKTLKIGFIYLNKSFIQDLIYICSNYYKNLKLIYLIGDIDKVSQIMTHTNISNLKKIKICKTNEIINLIEKSIYSKPKIDVNSSSIKNNDCIIQQAANYWLNLN